jgi:hypothetical protein
VGSLGTIVSLFIFVRTLSLALEFVHHFMTMRIYVRFDLCSQGCIDRLNFPGRLCFSIHNMMGNLKRKKEDGSIRNDRYAWL